MSETYQLILSVCALIIVYVLTRKIHIWREKRAYLFIIGDLKKKRALDPLTAVELPYARKDAMNFGLKNFRTKALEILISGNMVGQTPSGKYYLLEKKR